MLKLAAGLAVAVTMFLGSYAAADAAKLPVGPFAVGYDASFAAVWPQTHRALKRDFPDQYAAILGQVDLAGLTADPRTVIARINSGMVQFTRGLAPSVAQAPSPALHRMATLTLVTMQKLSAEPGFICNPVGASRAALARQTIDALREVDASYAATLDAGAQGMRHPVTRRAPTTAESAALAEQLFRSGLTPRAIVATRNSGFSDPRRCQLSLETLRVLNSGRSQANDTVLAIFLADLVSH